MVSGRSRSLTRIFPHLRGGQAGCMRTRYLAVTSHLSSQLQCYPPCITSASLRLDCSSTPTWGRKEIRASQATSPVVAMRTPPILLVALLAFLSIGASYATRPLVFGVRDSAHAWSSAYPACHRQPAQAPPAASARQQAPTEHCRRTLCSTPTDLCSALPSTPAGRRRGDDDAQREA